MDALIDYLEDLLIHRGHFNIDDELAVGNIERLRKTIQDSIKYNPYLEQESSKSDHSSTSEIIDKLKQINDDIYETLNKQYLLLNAYEALWFSERRNSAKSLRGKKRQEFHKDMFTREIAPSLLNRNLTLDVEDEVNICFIDSGEVVFPKSFIEIIETIETLRTDSKSLFFRGHENSSYRLMPSIYRGNAPYFEKELLYDTINLLPEEVRGSETNFEILTKLQHFGTPTRLLDLTTNPLVGLFFSCMNSSFNGEVLCFKVSKENIKLFDSDTVSILSNLSKMPFNFEINSIFSRSDVHFNGEDQIRELVHKIRNEKSYFENVIDKNDLLRSFFVTSKLDNPRIIRQSGAFIICGMGLYKLLPSPEIYTIEKNVSKRLIISKSLKRDVKRSLDTFNISSGSLFPDLSEVSGYIKSKYNL